mgnify:CR=1 FL=1
MAPSTSVLDNLTSTKAWGTVVRAILDGSQAPWGVEDFGSHWILAGHHIREQVADDRALVEFLRRFLPPYEGETIWLYRGENFGRFEAGHIGLAWTSDESVARMFGRGLNAVGTGGVLLKAQFDSSAIISGPNDHSNYLGESQYTLDPTCCIGLEVLEKFPPVA